MILTCSSCTTRFLVDPAAIGPTGRQVRCARCQYSWFQNPADDLVLPAAPEITTNMDPGLEAAAPKQMDMPAGRPAPLRSGANLPVLPRRSSRVMESMAWGLLALSAASLLGAGYMFRGQIIHAWPQAANLYVALGVDMPLSQLRLTDVAFSQNVLEGHPALTVTGAINNDGSETVTVPLVLVKLRNAAGRDIFQWTYPIPEEVLAAGVTVRFSTRLVDPPEEARNLEVTFAPHR